MSAGTRSANVNVTEYAKRFDAGEIRFYASDDTLLCTAQLHIPAFQKATGGKVECTDLPLSCYAETGVNDTIDYALLVAPLWEGEVKDRLTVSMSSGSGEVVVSGLTVDEVGGTIPTIDSFAIQRADIDAASDDTGSVELLMPTGNETLTEGGVGYWRAKVTLGDLDAEKVVLEESTDNESLWSEVSTDDYTGKDYRRKVYDGLWDVDASATHVRAKFVDVEGNTVTSSSVAITTTAPDATYADKNTFLAATRSGFAVGDRVIVSDQPAHGQEFRITQDGAETDFGTVYVFDDDLSTEQSENFEVSDDDSLAQTDVVAGTLRVEYGTSGDEYTNDEEYHGIGISREFDIPWIDFKTGDFAKHKNRLELLRDNSGTPTSGGHDITYKYATTDWRAKRVVYNRFDSRWFGCVMGSATDAESESNSHRYNWACIVANRRYNEGGYEWCYVTLDGVMESKFSRSTFDGVMPLGIGADISVPTVSWSVRGGVKMPDNAALWHRDTTHTDSRQERNAISFRCQKWQTFGRDDDATKRGVGRFLLYDGNVENNQDPWNNPGDYTSLDTELQDSLAWGGAMGYDYSDSRILRGCKWHIEYVHVGLCGGNGINIRAGDVEPSHDLVLDGTVRNHAFYSSPASKSIERVTVRNYGWGAWVVLYQSCLKGFRVIDASPDNPYVNFPASVIQQRQDNVAHESAGSDYWIDGVLSIEDFEIDVTDAPDEISDLTLLDSNINFGTTHYKNGLIISADTALPCVLHGAETGASSGEYGSKFTLENTKVLVQGSGNFTATGRNQTFDTVTWRRVHIMSDDATRNLGAEPLFFIEELNEAQVSHVLFDEVIVDVDHDSLLRFEDRAANSFPANVFFSGCKFSTTANVIEDPPGTGTTNGRIYLHDTLVPTYAADFSDLHLEKVGVRDIYDQSGRTSDDDGVYVSSASDEGNSYVRFPTNLIYTAQETGITLKGAPSTMGVVSTQYVQSDGSVLGSDKRSPYLQVNLSEAIATGDQIAVKWVARVTPQDRFQPSGAFIARDIADQDYLTGDGATTIDLVGHVASMETDEQPNYTVATSDASIVTASIDSSDVLTLTEQGTAGSATVTVTSEVGGYGEVTKEIAVTVYDSAPEILTNISGSPVSAYSMTAKLGSNHDYAYLAEELGGNTTQQIGFDSQGLVDTGALATFGGANAVVIHTLRDATTNRNDIVMSGQRPEVYDGSNAQTFMSLPSQFWNKNNGSATADTGITAQIPQSIYLAGALNFYGDGSRLLNADMLQLNGSRELFWDDVGSNIKITDIQQEVGNYDPLILAVRYVDANTVKILHNANAELEGDPNAQSGNVYFNESQSPITSQIAYFLVFDTEVSDDDDQQIRDDINLTYNLLGDGALY